ncbi:alpha-galactosidase [Bifidobacterium scardovii]|uniref:alpha-galactosidase n=2 Tax=Bifidobacterium scardovii TaxID=158787 RepID=UPI00242EE4C8|nr:alpha-galactosidase [Bifidobacterium scardovii]MBS6948860.1 alpha-galactosidase [Bifidobacterium scardovii]MDU3737851.1 alpha-galactosidase [Bifidobacterium scardovii]MDU5298466.1 alpha-galactosidase [Bifidobacterium scardovii]MDU5610100.1 alpha-galactosidase [Bifidobacterium scardovii]MDU5888163.1 alpha-galactosidase [Bifidobacterium scardovii]
MTILFDSATRQFHLRNDAISYVMRVLPGGELSHVYFGARLGDDGDLADEHAAPVTGLQTHDAADAYSLEDRHLEYPAAGSGDLNPAALAITDARGSHVVRPLYAGYRILDGKPALEGLPSTYVEDDAEAQTLEITLIDERVGLEIQLLYTLFADRPVIARSAKLTASARQGAAPIDVDAAYSADLDLADGNWDLITLGGEWGRECAPLRARLRLGHQGSSSLSGHTSHRANPYLVLARPDTTETHGAAIGASLAYSGNFDADVHVDSYWRTRLRIGINPELFRWRLEPGESLQLPEAVLAYSSDGIGALSRVYHSLYRTRMARGPWRDRRRPIVVNTWEAIYMKMDEDKLVELASSAKDLGIEMLVIDDGWFGHRNYDDTSLGDWFPNPAKFPNGLKPVGERVHALGLKLGLWFEPEMISRDSVLFETHPDWVLGDPDVELSVGRHQYLLDLTRPEVVDYLAGIMSKTIRAGGIDYIKWDMNRSLAEVYSPTLPAERQGEVYHRYVLGYYDLLGRLTRDFPDMLIESCCSGGGRVDPGVLAYAPQAWISDDTDAMERVKIQYGTSYAYPLSMMSNHVSAVPNAQTGRISPLKTRADVALFGTFGYELDPRTVTDEAEREQIRRQVALDKRFAALVATGDFYRLISPFASEPAFAMAHAAWMVVSPDRREALVGYYRTHVGVNLMPFHLRLAGLDRDAAYTVEEIGFDTNPWRPRRGDELEEIGLPFIDGSAGEWKSKIPGGDNISRLFHLTAR